MKLKLLSLVLAGSCANLAQAQFNPIQLKQSSYTYGIVVAADAVPIQPYGLTATVGDGESGGDYTFFESGMYNFGPNNFGVPVHNTSFTAINDANMTFQMAPSYTANDDLMIYENTDTSGTWSLTKPIGATELAFFGTGGNGGCTVNYTVTHSDNGTENGSLSWPDWFNGSSGGSTVAWETGGRIQAGGNLDIHGNNNGVTGNNGQPYVYEQTINISDSTPIVSITFNYNSGGGYDSFFAVSASTDGTHFAPVAVTGYNEQAIVPGFPVPITATMDAGTNISGGNPGTTWNEQGYDYENPAIGLPPSDTVFASMSEPGHNYQVGNYNTNNAILIDGQHLSVNLTPLVRTNYGELAFLTAGANVGSGMAVQCVIQHANGLSETNVFYGYDWYDTSHNSAIAWEAGGRIWMNNRTRNNYNSSQPNAPYLFESYFAINDITSPVTNITANYVSGGGTTFVLAVSGTTGASLPIILAGPTPGDQGDWVQGGTAMFSVAVTGTPPLTNTWLEEINGVYVPLANGTDVNGSVISGANTTNLTISGLKPADATSFEYVASNAAGSATSNPNQITLSVAQPPPASAYKSAVLSYHPVGYWPLDETSGTIAFDYAGTNNGAYEGNYQLGEAGLPASAGIGANTSVYFDGSTAYVSIQSGGLGWNLNITNAITVMEWVQTPQGGDNRFTTPLGHGDSSYRLDVTPQPHFADDGPDAVGSLPINDGNWHQLVGVYDGTNEYLYVDRNLVAGPFASISAGNADNLVIGAAPDYLGSRNFQGNIAQVAVYSNALTAPQIQSIYNALEAPAALAAGGDLRPLNGEAYSGAPVFYSVTALGSSPIHYQWTVDGLAVSGGTNASVTLPAQCGTHLIQVSFTNAYNNGIPISSSEATLEVTNSPAAVTFNTNGAGWQLNSTDGESVPTFVSNNVVELTDGGSLEASSLFYGSAQYVGDFNAAFTYQVGGNMSADGACFILQNVPAGTSALGGDGGALGYSGVSNSIVLAFDLFNNAGPGIAFETNGNTASYALTGSVFIGSGDPIDVAVNYANGIFKVSLTDTITLGTFATNYAPGPLTAILGSDLAYVGFSGADGGLTSIQTISNFVFTPVVTPVSLAVSSLGKNSLSISWPAVNPNFELQTATNLLGTWNVGPSPTEVNGTNYVTITPGGSGNIFYRLVLECQ